MSTPIQTTYVTPYQAYCKTSDVSNLIGNVLNSASFPASAISSYINEAVGYINRQTNCPSFSPYRKVERFDGDGKSRMVTAQPHIMAVNQLSVFFTYPLTLSRIANDWDLLIDREAGIISFPTYTASPLFAPFAFVFYPAAFNVELDAWYGYTRSIFGEQLTAPDSQTYTFANPTAIKQTQQLSYPYEFDQPPTLFPNIYKNGQLIQNTTYTLVTSQLATANNQWQIQQDNLSYTLQTGPNGITGIKFNSPNQPSDVITADYVYWYVPADITLATAKRAAVNILAAIVSGINSDNQYNGADMIMIDGDRVQYLGGQFSSLMNRWNAEVEDVIKRYKRLALDYSGGYIPDVSGGFWF